MSDATPDAEGRPLPARVVVAIFEREEDGLEAVEELRERGWDADRLAAAYRPPREVPPSIGSEHTSAGAGMVTGALVGGAAGLAIGAASLILPGVGPLVVFGTLQLGVLGVAKGGLLGSFIGLGIPKREAEAYVQAVRDGGFFVEAGADDERQAEEIARLLRSHQPRALHTHQTASSAT